MKGLDVRALGGTPKTWISSSFMSRDEGVASKVWSKERIGRDPLRQFPERFSSSLFIRIYNRTWKYAVCRF